MAIFLGLIDMTGCPDSLGMRRDEISRTISTYVYLSANTSCEAPHDQRSTATGESKRTLV